MNDRSWFVILGFGIWLFLPCFLGNLISVLNGIDSITIHQVSLFWVSFFFSHSRYDCSSQCFPIFFVFCFVFPQGSEPFHKCCVICFVQQNSLHAHTAFSPTHTSQCHFLLVITLTLPGHCLTSQARRLLSCVSGHVPSTLKNTWYVLHVQ